MKHLFKIYFFLFLQLTFLSNCEIFFEKKRKAEANKNRQLQFLFALLATDTGALAAKIFYINPLLKSNNPYNLAFVEEANSTHVNPAKKKLILVHGWDPDDRDSKLLSFSEQQGRVTTFGWKDFIDSGQFDAATTLDNFDVFGFDYLTSNPIDVNGSRFRAKMDSLFGNETGTVVIGAHSMGGLVSRFALYEGSQPAYIKRIITLGTPFHGSPWASPQFQASKGEIGKIAAFMTDTNGGRDLAWDNFDGTIVGASNSKLTNINAQTTRDNLFYAFYGSVNNTGTRGSGGTVPGLYLACPVLGSSFAPSDCIVPATSARLDGNTLGNTPTDLGAYDHLDIKLLISSIRITFYNTLILP